MAKGKDLQPAEIDRLFQDLGNELAASGFTPFVSWWLVAHTCSYHWQPRHHSGYRCVSPELRVIGKS